MSHCPALPAVLAILLFTLLSVTTTSAAPVCPACFDTTQLSAVLLTHGDPATSSYWSQLSHGFYTGCKMSGMSCNLYAVPGAVLEMAQQNVGTGMKQIYESMWSDSSASGSLSAMKNYGHPNILVTSLPAAAISAINSQFSLRYNSSHTKLYSVSEGYRTSLSDDRFRLHLGNDDSAAGQLIAKELSAVNHTRVLVLLEDSTDPNQQARVSAIRTALNSSPFCQITTCTVSTAAITTGDVLISSRQFTAALTPEINAVIAITTNIAPYAVSAIESRYGSTALTAGSVTFVCFDSSDEIVKLQDQNKISFVVDSQPYLQGLYAALLSAFEATSGELLVNDEKLFGTGPSLQRTHRDVNKLAVFPSRQRVTAQNLSLSFVSHAVANSGSVFWAALQQGGVQTAATFLRSTYRDCLLTSNAAKCGLQSLNDTTKIVGTNFYGLKALSDYVYFSSELSMSVAHSADGIISSIPDVNSLSAALSAVVNSSTPIMSANSGMDVFESLKMQAHVGLNEYIAGQFLGRYMASKLGCRRVVCANPTAGNLAFNQRCDGIHNGIRNYLTSIGVTVTAQHGTIRQEAPISDAVTTQQTINTLVAVYANDSTIDGAVALGASVLPTLVTSLEQAARLAWSNSSSNPVNGIKACTFDTTPATLPFILINKVWAAAGQQQELQGFLPTVMMGIQALTGMMPYTKTILSGPNFVSASNIEAGWCASTPVCSRFTSVTSNATASSCNAAAKGDGWCDAVNNNAACGYDGGDCCASTCRPTASMVKGFTMTVPCGNTGTFTAGLNAYQCVDPNAVENVVASGKTIVTPFDSSSGIEAAGYALSALAMLVVLFVAAVVFKYRNTIVIKSASFNFCMLMLLNNFMLALGAIFYMVTPEHGQWVCDIRPWLTALPLVGVLSNLLLKSYRIKQIFNNPKLRVQVISNTELLGKVGVLMLAQVVLLIGFSAAQLSEHVYKIGEKSTSSNVVHMCSSTESTGFTVWLAIQFVFVFTFLAVGLYIAFSIRNVPAAFNDSSHIANAIFGLSAALIILVPLQFIVADNPDATALIRSFGQSLSSIMVCAAIFGVKIYYLFTGRGNDKRLHTQGTNKTIMDNASVLSMHNTNSTAAGPTTRSAVQDGVAAAAVLQQLRGDLESEAQKYATTSEGAERELGSAQYQYGVWDGLQMALRQVQSMLSGKSAAGSTASPARACAPRSLTAAGAANASRHPSIPSAAASTATAPAVVASPTHIDRSESGAEAASPDCVVVAVQPQSAALEADSTSTAEEDAVACVTFHTSGYTV